jgi:hypothetical protein
MFQRNDKFNISFFEKKKILIKEVIRWMTIEHVTTTNFVTHHHHHIIYMHTYIHGATNNSCFC